MTAKSKTFCILPFIHIQVKPNGQIKPCCRFDFVHDDYIDKDWTAKNGSAYHVFNKYNISNGSTLTEAMTSNLWNDVRNNMLNGKPVSGCRKCYTAETFNGRSMRVHENYARNDQIQDSLSSSIEPLKIKYLEMTFGNYCNLKCRTCAGDLSSTWHEEEALLAKVYPGRYSSPKVLNIPFNWKPEDFVNIEEIKFTGGEPMIHPDFLKLMDMLIEIDVAKNIALDVFTNCSWIPGGKFFKRLTKFKQVKISLSIDGVGKTNDYIRTPSDWRVVDSVVDSWLAQEAADTNKIQITWNPTINIYNILEIDNMIDWWDNKQNGHFPNRSWPNLTEKDYKEDHNISSFRLIFNILQDPKYLSISNLPQSAKELANRTIKSIYDKYDSWDMAENPRKEIFNKKMEAIRGALNSTANIEMLKLFASYTEDLDKLRTQSLKDSLPLLYKELEGHVDYTGKL
jgi:sulfatase maturation enzyme AslB (radical SAM superfamily)